MLNTHFSPWPSLSAEEIAAVADVLSSNRVNYWTGQQGRNFEEEFSAWCGAKHSVALANGTVALELALRALGVGPGDEVIVTPRSFIASVSCVVTVGARPVFAEVDRDSGNITAATIGRALSPKTKAVIPVHLAGWPCDMDPIMKLAAEHGLKVIEDCAQAHGARYKSRSVGTIGHIGAWSFCQDKIMTTGGEGGMVTTDDSALWRRMWSYKDHGKDWDAVSSLEQTTTKGFRWVHHSFGTNWRMLEIQAAIGRVQLRHVDAWTKARNMNSQLIREACQSHDCVRVPEFRCNAETCPTDCPRQSGCVHACYKFYVYVRPEALAEDWDRDRIVAELALRGVPCFQGSCPEIYLEKCFAGGEYNPPRRLPVAKELGETSLMFLVHPTLTADEMTKTCFALHEVLGEAGR